MSFSLIWGGTEHHWMGKNCRDWGRLGDHKYRAVQWSGKQLYSLIGTNVPSMTEPFRLKYQLIVLRPPAEQPSSGVYWSETVLDTSST